MEKNMIILEIINLYDENERLRHSVEWLSRTNGLSCDSEPEHPNKWVDIDKEMIKKGKAKVLENAISYWRPVKCTYDEEKDIYNVASFDNWLKEVLRKDYIPNFMSYKQFIEYFHEDLMSLYNKEKTKALNEAKGIENVEEE